MVVTLATKSSHDTSCSVGSLNISGIIVNECLGHSAPVANLVEHCATMWEVMSLTPTLLVGAVVAQLASVRLSA